MSNPSYSATFKPAVQLGSLSLLRELFRATPLGLLLLAVSHPQGQRQR